MYLTTKDTWIFTCDIYWQLNAREKAFILYLLPIKIVTNLI